MRRSAKRSLLQFWWGSKLSSFTVTLLPPHIKLQEKGICMRCFLQYFFQLQDYLQTKKKSLWFHLLCHHHVRSNMVRKCWFIICLNHVFFANNGERCQVPRMPAACKVKLKHHQGVTNRNMQQFPRCVTSAASPWKTQVQSLQWEHHPKYQNESLRNLYKSLTF